MSFNHSQWLGEIVSIEIKDIIAKAGVNLDEPIITTTAQELRPLVLLALE